VYAGSAAELAELDRLILPGLQRQPAKEQKAGVSVRLSACPEGYAVHADGKLLGTAPDMRHAAVLVQAGIDDAVIEGMRGHVAVHAGVVALDGAAALVTGPSHAGKSTLVAELVSRGATYFSDEFALIDANGLAHPYPRALMLRDGTPSQRAVPATDLGGVVGTGPAPVKLILQLVYESGASWSARPVPQSEGLMMLLENTRHILEEKPHLFGWLGAAVRKAACFRGVRGQAPEAAGRILELLRAAS
jgi:hypothetical protein